MNFKRLEFERRKMEREMDVDLNFRRKIRQKLYQIVNAVNNEIGDVLVKSGVVIGACGGIVRLLLCFCDMNLT